MSEPTGGKKYGVSSLNTSPKARNDRAAVPKVEFRARQEDIGAVQVFIPGVTLAATDADAAAQNDSPRSINTEQSALTANSGYKIAPGRHAGSQAKSTRPTASLKMPVQILKGSNTVMIVEVSARTSGSAINSSGQMSLLEQGLPTGMQGYRKKVAAELLHKLRESLSLSSSIARQQQRSLDHDDYSVGSSPEHFSSGASLSLKHSKLTGGIGGGGIPGLWHQRAPGIPSNSLWAQPGTSQSIAHREIVLEKKRRGEHVQEDNAAYLRAGNDDSLSRQTDGVGSRNDVDDEEASLRMAIRAGEYLARHSLAENSQEHVHNVGGGGGDSVYSHGQSDVDHDHDYNASQSILSIGEHEHQHQHQHHHSSADHASSQQRSEHRHSHQHHVHEQEGDEPDENMEDLSADYIADLLSNSKPKHISLDHIDFQMTSLTRQKLQQLGRYVLGHTFRKILVAWNLIDAKFQKSSLMKTEMVRDDSTGLNTPQKHSALPLSTVVAMLCSPQVRVMHSELPELCKRLDCDVEDVQRARRIAAIRLILGPDQGKNLKQADVLLGELRELTDTLPAEKLVSGLQFKNVVFPASAAEREKALQTIEDERSLWIRQQVEEKRKREELKERVETRRRKLMQDYDDSLSVIQFSKGPLAPYKLQALKELIEYCRERYIKANLTQDVAVSEENVSLLGRDAFPQFVQDSPTMQGGEADSKDSKSKSSSAALLAQQQQESSSSESVAQVPQRVGYEGQFRIRLQGQANPGGKSGPSVLFLIKETVSYGKGLNGLAYRDVVEMLQSYAVTRISAVFRRNKRHWRYKIARTKWRAKFQDIKVRCIQAWFVYVKHVFDTKTFCFRPVKAWQFFTRRRQLRREHFRIGFWPFYVWHRWAAARRTAAEKTRFLIYRILPCYLTLRNFRAWKRYHRKEMQDRALADGHVLRWTQRRGLVLLKWYRYWTRRRKRIRLAWLRSGMHTHKAKVQLCKMTPFLIWKSYWHYKRLMHVRVKTLSFQFRSSLLDSKKPLRPLTVGQRREACIVERKAEEAAIAAAAEAAALAAEPDSSDDEGDARTRKSKDTSIPGAAQEEEEEEETRPRSIVPFRWQLAKRWAVYDIPSDGEDDVRADRVNQSYAEVPAMPLAAELDFLEKADEFIMRKVAIMSQRFRNVDKLDLIETSLRYHRYMHRAFINILTNARIRKSSRIRAKKMNHRRKMQSFLGLVTWMLRSVNGGVNMSDQTPAEEIFYAAKDHRMDKMMKWRDIAIQVKAIYDIAIQVKAIYGRDTISSEDKRGKKKGKKEDDVPKELFNPDGTPFIPPNFLEWDREDRQIETEQAETMVLVSREVRLKVIDITERAQVESEIYNTNESLLNRTVNEVLETENNITQAAIEAEMLYISSFKIHAAGNLINVLLKIFREVEIMLIKHETKKYFRMLRMPMLTKRGEQLYNVKKMANWIRICQRLICISRKAPVYHRQRTMWVFYNRWLKLVEKESLDATPGLVNKLTRRKEIYPSFSRLLVQAGFKRVPYSSSKRLYYTCSNLRAIFYRWVQETIEDVNFRIMEKRAADLFNWRLLQRCFYCLRTSMGPEDTLELRRQNKPYVLVRAQADLEQVSKRFIAVRRRSLSYNLASLNRRLVTHQKRDARRAPTMKSFIASYRYQVNRRLVREQRILLDAFEARGTQHFKDVVSPDGHDAIMPGLMSRVEGVRFCDPQPERSVEEEGAEEDDEAEEGDEIVVKEEPLPPLPGGFKIHKIRVNHSVDMGQPGAIQGVVGWQLVWSADGCKDHEGPKRGRWKGAAMRVHELTIAKDEFVVGLEYCYEGVSILGIRVKLFFSGWSRWLGDKPGVSTLTLYLGPEMSPLLQFEREYVSPGRDEDDAPALPRSFIIGFSGLETQGRLTGLTMVIRKVIEQHIFSYYWVGDALANKRAREVAIEEAAEAAAVAERIRNHYAKQEELKNSLHPSPSGSHHDSLNDHHLPAISGASIASSNRDDDSIGDMSSISHGSKGLGQGGQGAGAGQGLKDDASVGSGAGAAQIRHLTSSEEQFFDVFRMRLMEIKLAEERAERFSRKLWSARQIRDHPVLKKLSTINIIAPLTRWYFASICKRVVKALPTEDKGEELLEESKKDHREADRLQRRSINEYMRASEFESQPKPWSGQKFLSPHDRALRKAYQEELRSLKNIAFATKLKGANLTDQAARKAKEGRSLLPRMCLSRFICTLYHTKIAAARHKESLLQDMDLESIKRALLGGEAKLSELTDVAMDMIRYALAERKPPHDDPLALEKLVEAEVRRAKANLEAARTASNSAVRSTSSSTIGGGLAATLVSTGGSSVMTPSASSRSSPHIMEMSTSASVFLPLVSVSTPQAKAPRYMMTNKTSPEMSTGSRKRTGLSMPIQFSRSASLFKLQPALGVNKRKTSLLLKTSKSINEL